MSRLLRRNASAQHTRLALLCLIVLGGTLLWLTFRAYTGMQIEDALITYRYAENLAQGHGYVYNLGERVQGTTTPLFTLLLAFLILFSGAGGTGIAAGVLGLAAGVGAGLLLFAALDRAKFPSYVTFGVTALYFFNPVIMRSTLSGMETPLVLFCMSLSLYSLLSEKWALASIAAGLVIVTRPDGLIWALLVLGSAMWQAPRRWKSIWLPALAIAASWFLFATLYFGNPFPQSLLAKAFTNDTPNVLARLTPGQLGAFLNWLLPFLGFPFGVENTLFGGFSMVAFVLLLSLPALFRHPKFKTLLILPLFSVGFALAMYLGNAPFFPWYLVPLTWATLILAGIGLEFLWEMLSTYGKQLGFSKIPAFAFMTAFLGLMVLFGSYDAIQSARILRQDQINETQMRQKIGEWLNENTPAHATVAMEAIGYQGYFARRKVIDLGGLVSPRVIEIYRTSENSARAFERILQELQPDYLVLRSFEVDENRNFAMHGPLFANRTQKKKFQAQYVEAKRFHAPIPIWGELGALTIYARRAQQRRTSPLRAFFLH